MKIEIELKREEVKEIIEKHVLSEFPNINFGAREIYTSESYGTFTVAIEEKIQEKQPETTEDAENE